MNKIITNNQIPRNKQIPITNNQYPKNFGHWKLKNWLLFGYCFLVIGYFSSDIGYSAPCLAQSFSSDNFRIQWGNFNITSGKKTSTNYQLTDTVGQNAPGEYTRSGYVLKSGFQYIYDTFYAFSFNIDDLNIDFGTLIPDIGTTDTNVITVSSPAGHGYQIMVHENHPLSSTGTTIPDTNCNSGCSESTSGVWSNSSAYGFGFNAIGINSSGVATGIGTSDYFSDSTYFRQFANYSASETQQTIMSENSPAKNRSAKITYKVNIPPQQSSGNYENAIIFTAIPKY